MVCRARGTVVDFDSLMCGSQMSQKVRPCAAVAAILLLNVSASCCAEGFTAVPLTRNLSLRPVLSSSAGNVKFQARLSVLDDKRTSPLSATALALSVPRAGALISDALTRTKTSPDLVFDTLLGALSVTAISLKAMDHFASRNVSEKVTEINTNKKPQVLKSLQLKYLSTFWLLRCGYWMSGPYVYAAYASKVFNGVPASLALVSKIFLSGFLATAIFGPSIGKATDKYGRKKGTLAFALFYSIGVSSIKSNLLWILFAGRAIVGIALSLLFCAPEAWVAGEASRLGLQARLGETFSLAYEGDSLVAIAAGKLAGVAANARGPTGPFDLSIVVLAAGALVSAFSWRENTARDGSQSVKESKASDISKDTSKNGATIAEAFDMIRNDPKLFYVGAVQTLFEAAMNVFILQWPPALNKAVAAAFGGDAKTPFGTIFSCFMSCSLLGSILFGQLNKKNVVSEDATAIMLSVATVAMAGAAISTRMSSVPFSGIVAAFFVYEACVGMYFPAMGTLRSRLVPDSHKSLILSVFGIPLNLIVVAIFLSINHLGVSGALGISAGGLALATASMLRLRSIVTS